MVPNPAWLRSERDFFEAITLGGSFTAFRRWHSQEGVMAEEAYAGCVLRAAQP